MGLIGGIMPGILRGMWDGRGGEGGVIMKGFNL